MTTRTLNQLENIMEIQDDLHAIEILLDLNNYIDGMEIPEADVITDRLEALCFYLGDRLNIDRFFEEDNEYTDEALTMRAQWEDTLLERQE